MKKSKVKVKEQGILFAVCNKNERLNNKTAHFLLPDLAGKFKIKTAPKIKSIPQILPRDKLS